MPELSARAKHSMSKHQTFTKLVTSDTDFVGMVAYTIYKNEKLDWIAKFKEKNEREPNATEVEQFNLSTDSELKIQHYRDLAEDRVNDFIGSATIAELTEYRTRLRDDAIIQSTNSLANASKKGFWHGVGENVVAGVIGAGIVTLFQLGIWLYQMKDNPEFKKQATEQIQQTAN